jgi:alpha-tubulin suppressor-like RCC1 family protein
MPTYDGTYKLAVEDGRVLIRDVEGGSQTTHVPLEIYSNYAAQGTLTDSRQLRLRTQPYLESNAANAYVTDMGIESGQTDNYFFITAPQKTANAGDRSTFVISKTSNVGIGTTDPEKPLHVVGDSWVTGTLTASNIVGASPVTISSNLVMASGFTLTAGAIEPPAGSETTLKGGTTASITNSNAFPNFIFSRNSNAAVNHVGGGHNAARHALFPDDTGKVWAVGEGNRGGLGLGDSTDRNVYTLVSALDGVANIVASSAQGYTGNSDYEMNILLDDTGNVWTCGGIATNGQQGHGDTKERYIPTLVTTNIYSGVSITEVTCGTTIGMVLDSTGQIWGCGYNVDYRIGNLSGSTASTNSTFIPTYPGTQGQYTFTSIDCGWQHSLALEDNGRIWSTGLNTDGRAGQGGLSGVNGWTLCPNGTTTNPALSEVTITQICSAENASVALDSTGNVWTTGTNTYGALGHGDTSSRNYFERVTTNVNAASGVTAYKIATGSDRTRVLDTNGRMWVCGYNGNGDLGNPPYATTITTFIRVDAGPIADKSITDFALTNRATSIVRTSDNEYYVAGAGGESCLGTGDTHNRYTFTKILDVNANPPPDYGYTRSLLLENTETGKGPSIELKNSDAVSSRIQMEDGASGKLNIGFVDASFDPKLSGGDGAVLEPFQERTQSNTMTRGVTINQAGGTMVAGGSTSNIGLNAPVFNSGVRFSNMYGYADPSQLGYNYGMAAFVTTPGNMYVAGDNIYGGAGNGTTSNVNVWTESTPPSAFKIRAFGGGVGSFRYAIDENTKLWRTGSNGNGQLALGDTDNISSWSSAGGYEGFGVSHGIQHVLVLGTDNQIYACGYGGEYALGTGTAAQTTTFITSTSGDMTGQAPKWVCAGRRQSFAIRSDDVLVFVGNNSQGVAGNGTTTSPVTTWTVIASSNFDSKTPRAVYLTGQENTREGARLITTDGKIYGTGANDKGQLGVGDTTNKTTWTAATGDITSQTVTRVACADRATFALDSTGKVWSCGDSVYVGQGLTDDDADLTTFTKITKPDEFYSKTITNIMGQGRGAYAVDSEGTLWATGGLVGLGTAGINPNQQFFFAKVPIYDVVPKAFQYTPTLTLENPNADYGATVEFKNPNNRAFINLDDKTSTLRLGFVDNENNAGQFRGLSISPNNWEFSGYISHQNPIFYAYVSGAGPASSSYVTYDETFVNVGSNYNIANGVFTCPVAGIYTFTWGAIGNYSSTIYRYYIRKNDVNVGDTHLRLDTKSTSGNDYGVGQRSVTFSLSLDDTIRIYYISENGTSDYGNQYTYFQGQLISTN